MHHGISVIGKTTTGQDVYDGLGCFKIVESHGLPLDLLLDKLDSQNSVIELSSFLEAAINQGCTFIGYLSEQNLSKLKLDDYM